MRFFLSFLSLLIVCRLALAQKTPSALADKNTLHNISETFHTIHQKSRESLLQTAREKGWAIIRKDFNGGIMLLSGKDAFGLPVYKGTYNNIRSAATTSTDLLWPGGSTGLNLSGSSAQMGSRMAIWDGAGVLTTHQEFGSRVQQEDSPSSVIRHSTHVAGTLIATGINRPAKGMAFKAPNLLAFDFFDDNSEMANQAATLLLSNHSYGAIAGWHYNGSQSRWEWYGPTGQTEDYKFGYYDVNARNWDIIAYNAPYYLIVKSVGNNRAENGPGQGDDYYRFDENGQMSLAPANAPFPSKNDSFDVLSLYSNAKNIVTVGAINPILGGYKQVSDAVMTGFSSWGPTDDGRIKPDLVGNGVGVLSTSSTTDDAYTILSGTSMAAPNITGSLFLLQELYSNLHNGTFMRSATLKGLAIHTASEAGNAPGPDYRFGWGVLNTFEAAKVIQNRLRHHLILEDALDQGETDSFRLIATGNSPIKATICWTDPEAEVIAEQNALDNPALRLVNDLDIRLKDSISQSLFSPWVLDPAQPAIAASTGDNFRDNVESIIVLAPKPGTVYTLKVTHKNTLTRGPQQYSLVVSGIGGQLYCKALPTDSNASFISGLQFSNLNYISTGSCGGYTDLLDQSASLISGDTMQFQLTTGTCSTPETAFAKLFIDWNVDGDFNDANENYPAANGTQSGGTLGISVAVPDGLALNLFTRARLILSESSSIMACGNYAKGETLDFSVRISQADKDMAIMNIDLKEEDFCPKPQQYLSIRLKNKGSEDLSNIPISAKITFADKTITRTGVFKGTLTSNEEALFTFDRSFSVNPSTNYEFTITAPVSGDQNLINNQFIRNLTSKAYVTAPNNLQAFICANNNEAELYGNGGGTVFWYASETENQIVAVGDSTFSTAVPSNQIFYAAIDDFSGTVGPANKAVFPPVDDGNAYNQFTPSVRITTQIPLSLETARLYVGYPGKISFTVLSPTGVEIDRTVLHVDASKANPAIGQQPYDQNDTGKVYYLGLDIPEPGSYLIDIGYEGSDASIFRNNKGVEGYPFTLPGIMSITGNTASEPNSHYYYFYNLKVKSLGCPSERVAVNAQTRPKPVINQQGDTLYISSTGTVQWFFNDEPIQGATAPQHTIDQSGIYTVLVNTGACDNYSDAFRAKTLTDSILESEERALLLFPNPANQIQQSSNGIKFSFLAKKTEKGHYRIIDISGKQVYSETIGVMNDGENVISIPNNIPLKGIYILDLMIDNSQYSRKFIVH